ncbi:glucan biosynthesis protein [Xanthobacter tagetidis]|uniref:glucan biosynthesis protein n=1 Tax=Xanthobacter tagetidis TaxID=60216 RepID=UPI0017AF733F|nr:glucan biosynthesis protein G [Xanthobacter tagetidis]MBB6307431.1 glucans biosynthesis protein [Xanthobacter tagetidis]
MLDRRSFVLGAALLPVLDAVAARPALAKDGERFNADTVRNMARQLAAQPFKQGNRSLPAELDKLSYDDYRNIRFNMDRAVWRGQQLPFEMQLLHRGFLFRDQVDVFVVADGRARRIDYDPGLFRFEHGLKAPAAGPDFGFSGFRLHGLLNRPDYLDEIAVFQGASYFRAVGKGQGYGTSARGLAVKTAAPSGEEFPVFRAFYVEQPRAHVPSIVVHALLDSPSATAAHRFTIRPGDATVMSVEMALYPRTDLAEAGIAPLTSMFLFGPADHIGFDDFRPAVRDAEGLAVIGGAGEYLWRPLANPVRLQISVFSGSNMRGFGLMQRQRSFFDYQDLEARYEKRPSVWVEPIGDWGEGAVHLVEIPTPEEVHDNIVAFWRPKDILRKGSEYTYTYRLHWVWDMPTPPGLGRVAGTRAGGTGERRLFVVDLVDGPMPGLALDGVRADVSASAGEVRDVVVQPNPEMSGVRLSFAFEPKGAGLSELRARLLKGDTPLSETWLYRWTP